MTKKYKKLQAGILLIAEPGLHDFNFKRTVILLCEHNSEGSFGLVLNKPMDLLLSDILDEEFSFNKTLFIGGPVQQETLHIIHRVGDIIEGRLQVIDHVFWGGDFGKIKDILKTEPNKTSDFRFFLGYSGWAPGQLENELDAGGWVVTEATEDIIFLEDTDYIWRSVMKQLGGEYALFSNTPDDPSLN